jgi:putative PIN family toxin of toxin-antitoxin system
MQPLVLDTNVVLDAFVFDDAAARPLRQGLGEQAFDWIATAAMRDELQRVLGYPQIARRLAFYALEPAAVLAAFDRHARVVAAAPKAPTTCKDADDQKFIDLAVTHGAWLLSKDQAVLSMRRRLALLGVHAGATLEAITPVRSGPPWPWASTA